MKFFVAIAAAAVLPAVNAQVSAWGQCGGINYTGSTTCTSGYTCVKLNDYYSQCQPGTGTTTTSVSATTTSTSTTLRTSTVTSAASGNPISGYSFYANPHYASEILSTAVPSLSSKGSTTWAAKATNVANVGTFYWLDVRAKVPTIAQYAADVQKKNAAGQKLVLPLVVYDLPDRDCAALASNGELSIANGDATIYKTGYIDEIRKQIQAYPDVKFILVIEPDSLANLVTNMNVAKCSNAASTYKELVTYAMAQLNLDNVAMYLDAGHAGWLGWSANISPAAQLFGDLYKAAGSPKAVRGLATNVANYNAWTISTCPSYTSGQEVASVKIIRNKQTGQSEGYGFVEFISHVAAERVLQSYNGIQMPNTEQLFRLNWASFGIGEKRPDVGPDYPIFVGDLAADVTDYLLQETFRTRYTSVRGAKVVTDRVTGRPKGYGFVRFGDENEQIRAMTEMNGVYCSTRAMRIGPATTKKTTAVVNQQYPAKAPQVPPPQTASDNDPNNTTIFVGGLDPSVTDEALKHLFAQYGEVIHVKIPMGKRCGFVQFSSRACAEEAMVMLHGTVLGQQSIRLSWGRSPANKQSAGWAQPQQPDPNQWNGAYYGYGQGYDSGYGYAQQPQDPNVYGYGSYAYGNYQQQVN